jgi:hypothetical protein
MDPMYLMDLQQLCEADSSIRVLHLSDVSHAVKQATAMHAQLLHCRQCACCDCCMHGNAVCQTRATPQRASRLGLADCKLHVSSTTRVLDDRRTRSPPGTQRARSVSHIGIRSSQVASTQGPSSTSKLPPASASLHVTLTVHVHYAAQEYQLSGYLLTQQHGMNDKKLYCAARSRHACKSINIEP